VARSGRDVNRAIGPDVTVIPMLRLAVLASAVTLAVAGAAEAQFDTPSRQFHNQTPFPLDGRHRDLPCESCHRQAAYKGTPTRCFDCHWTRRQDDRYRRQLGSQCEQCHTTNTWTAVRWEHGAMTGMPLGVAHRQLSCRSCHANDAFRTAQATCFSCHQEEYQATRTPSHVLAGFPTACDTCHRPGDATFTQARFDHNTAFPLVGAHVQQTCVSCHRGNVFRGTPRECVGCHRADYERTTAPSHVVAGFATACESCHRPADGTWRTGFNHNAVFALVGTHAQRTCASCHLNNTYRGTPRDCAGCHRSAYDRTTSPNHAAAGFPTSCESCHRASDATWQQGTFSHRFPITSGPHRTSCSTCHQGGSFPTFTCLTCHEHDRARMDDKHKERPGYRYDSLACYGCHPNGRH
jgi:hypothetical protein